MEKTTENATVALKVEGMSCNNCALSISRYLEKEGMKDVMVSFATGDVRFRPGDDKAVSAVVKGIHGLGYQVVSGAPARGRVTSRLTAQLLFTLPFTVLLLLHMFVPWHWLHQPYVQLTLVLPVYIVGMVRFGSSALRSLRAGVPNMDVLVSMGATAAFVYSLLGTVRGLGDHYLFYETAASIITLVLLGNYLEEKSVRQTTTAITGLAAMQVTAARRIDPLTGEIREVANGTLVPGDQVLVNTGDQVPADGEVIWGEGYVSEAMITGESEQIHKKNGDRVIGGTISGGGSFRMKVTATGEATVLAHIIELVRQAQGTKSPMQRLADRISAVFVPVVIAIAVITFLVSCYVFSVPATEAMMRAIAVLVIACPCAMGLATPAAVMVGLGRAAKNGILIKGPHTLERFTRITQVVFDKTGTLTTGKPGISGWKVLAGSDEAFRRTAAALESHSSHPIAAAITGAWSPDGGPLIREATEVEGLGLEATDEEGNAYRIGSYQVARPLGAEEGHQVYVVKNDRLLGWIDLSDTVRPDAKAAVDALRARGIRTVMLSGDSQARAEALGALVGIDEIYGSQSPSEKMERIRALTRQAPTAMVGDGINDAPALTLADIGIALSDASHIAMQSADVVLLSERLGQLPLALGLGTHTYLTIKQNLFWAFFYNVVAIPVAAFGLLSPIVGAAVMGLSDVVLAVNSLRLRYKKVT
jgi:Cu+-exporting ATPase